MMTFFMSVVEYLYHTVGNMTRVFADARNGYTVNRVAEHRRVEGGDTYI